MKTQNETGDQKSYLQRIIAAVLALAAVGCIGWFVYSSALAPGAQKPFRLGLDLSGGSHLVYEADVTQIASEDVSDLMNVLRDVIEARVNIFGVSEPIVQVEQSSFVSGEPSERLVVELPGVQDVSEAIAEIGKTPLLEFKLLDQEALQQQLQESIAIDAVDENGEPVEVAVGDDEDEDEEINPYIDTGLTGRYLDSAALEFAGQQTSALSEPVVSIRFTKEGAELFSEITSNNVGESLAIFLDGQMVSAPRINEAIPGGTAIISGGFTPEEARDLAQNLSFGALPVDIELVSTQTIGASLGEEVLQKGIMAGAIGLMLVSLFMVLWYRLLGVVASVALCAYVVIMLGLFLAIPVTITAAGLAGLVLSLGMAVDANVLVFERMKEEYRSGKGSREAAQIGFSRAWSAIRDGNITSLLSAIVLFWFGTSLVKGFALVFGLGVLVSMITALLVTRTILLALPNWSLGDGFKGKLYDSGLGKK